MAKISDNNRISNEEIEAIVDEFLKKLEILRVRYEQYFLGIEKVAPTVMRMDVARIMRELEQVKVKNTALKFKIRQGIQKFTSYSTYWNRTLREIEDGTYKRHVDRKKRHEEAQKGSVTSSKANEARAPQSQESREATKAVADEAEAFLAGLGLGTTPKQPQSVSTPTNGETVVQTSHPIQQQTMLRNRRPTIVASHASTQQQPVSPVVAQPTKPVIVQPAKPVIVQPAKPVIAQPAKPVIAQPAKPVIAQPAKPVIAQPAKPVIAQPAKPVIAQPAKPVIAQPSVAAQPPSPTLPKPPAINSGTKPPVPTGLPKLPPKPVK